MVKEEDLFTPALVEIRHNSAVLDKQRNYVSTLSALGSRDFNSPSRIARSIYEADGLFSEPGRYVRMSMVINDQADFPSQTKNLDAVFHQLWRDPTNFRDRAVWLFFMSLLEAQSTFARKACQAPSREESLSGALLAYIDSSCENWKLIGQNLLTESGDALAVGRIDLQVGGGEQRTGGDFAMVLEFESQSGRMFLPLIFQAKV